ncbi:MAG: ribonuclease III [Eubacteriales bacterium]|nr:ribonuclease III [Eubacteriales bacterium]
MKRERADLLLELQQQIGYQFNDRVLLDTALTHKTYAMERKGEVVYNERLEFLGDAVLELCVSDYLYRGFSFREGSMTKMRAAAVSAGPLDRYAETIELGKYMRFGNGAAANGLAHNKNVLSDAVEALIGAVYLDGGFEAARSFVLRQLREQIGLGVAHENSFDSKTRLQELLQQNGGIEIEYRCEREDGPDHEKTFLVSLWVNGDRISEGEGKNKKDAEQAAAARALSDLREKEVSV